MDNILTQNAFPGILNTLCESVADLGIVFDVSAKTINLSLDVGISSNKCVNCDSFKALLGVKPMAITISFRVCSVIFAVICLGVRELGTKTSAQGRPSIVVVGAGLLPDPIVLALYQAALAYNPHDSS